MPPDDGGNDPASEPPKGLRLSDAERIAAERLDGAAEGLLEEALAIAPVGDASNAGPPPADAADVVGDSLPAEPPAHSADIAPSAEASGGQPVHSDAPDQPPLAPVVESAPAAPADGVAASSMAASGVAAEAEPAAQSAEDLPTDVGAMLEASAAAPFAGAAVEERVQPLASALDAAAKLAADANAAAEALENLKRLLERQLPNVAAGPPASAPRADAEAWPAASAPPTRPPPLPAAPLHRVGDGGGLPEPEPQLPAPLSPRRMPAERQRLDIRGFLAGFALSWAFGVVFYLFMTAG
jgi:hypothetical protein